VRVGPTLRGVAAKTEKEIMGGTLKAGIEVTKDGPSWGINYTKRF